MIFYAASTRSALQKLRTLGARLKPDGSLRVIRPRGRPEISEMDVMNAGKGAGLVHLRNR